LDAPRLKNDLPWVLGISASQHNASVCVLHGDQVCVAIQEERLSGQKRAGFSGAESTLAVPYALNAAGIQASDLDMVVLCTAGYPVADVRNDLSLNPQLRINANHTTIRVIPHHLGHAIGAYALSGFKEAAILVVDGLGSPYSDLTEGERQRVVEEHPLGWEHLSLYEAKGKSLTCLEKHLTTDRHWLKPIGPGMQLFSSFGATYSAVAEQIFANPLEAGKVMGLAPYGVPRFGVSDFYVAAGSAFKFSDSVPQHFQHSDRWPNRKTEYENLAASVQLALQQAILSLADRLKRLSGAQYLCYAGGVALNCTTNELLYQSGLFTDIFIMPAAEDSGVAIGAAYHGLWSFSQDPVRPSRFNSDGLGRTYSEADIRTAVESTSGIFKVKRFPDSASLYEEATERLINGEVCAWFDGSSELGPRALGQRSLLADPRKISTKTRVNDQIKKRESFRPLAPAIMEERVAEWFDVPAGTTSPFMLRNWKSLESKLPLIPAVVHVDGTARVQTVKRCINPRFYQLLETFANRTNVPILLNTSFNGPGEPIVETPSDALWSFVALGVDYLLLGEFLITLDERWSSLLDLVPTFSVNNISCSLRVIDGKLETNPTAHFLTANISTPWGTKHLLIPKQRAQILREIDGKRTGWQLLERLGSDGPGLDHDTLVRELSSLRRTHVISFGSP
jgi:carbamoyltransferase